ncbi:hypothetical protein CYY_002106 [Polysphondylium violaceum]|uniref:Uncharacterized protein n=1 Tax=Polysphondylium violaceum TaxID=133409 RepID=A0A8J4V129_9MYCE|nr:hypothetical protein CYY_002106 [Polysphondylium violaceum]
MGRYSIELLVYTTSEKIKIHQEMAKKKILKLILKSKITEPVLFNYIKQIQEDDSDDREWNTKLNEEFKQTSYTANKIIAIRKDLCLAITNELEIFKETMILQADNDKSSYLEMNINTSPIFAPLYCRLLQLEQFLFHLN